MESQLIKNISLNQFMKRNRVVNGSLITHTGMFDPKGSFSISRNIIEEFYQKYNHTIPNGFTEMPQSCSMLVFDFDIIKNTNEYEDAIGDNGRFYDDEEAKYVIKSINTRLKKVIKDCKDENLVCCLLEKDIYQDIKKPEIMKGGFHLQYHNLFIEKSKIMDNIINPIKEDILNETNLEFDDVYSKPWLLYGASKSENHKPYILSKIYNIAMEEMTISNAFENYNLYDVNEDKIEITPENVQNLLPRIMSVFPFGRDSKEIIVLNDVKPKEIIERKPKKNDNRDVEEKLAECRKLLPLLSENRVDSHGDWMKLGWCLYSIGAGCDEALALWDEKSQESSKYDAGCCDDKWNSMKVGEYTIGTLKLWAKEDSPEAYAKLYKKKDCCEDWVIECAEKIINDFSHTNLADIYSKYNQGELFFTTAYGWIIFDKKTRIWSWNNGKTSLIYPIATFFRKVLIDYSNNYFEKNNSGGNRDEEKIFQERVKQLSKMKMTASNSGFIKGVIEQVQPLLTKPNEFIDIFDSKSNIFSFSDGQCIDLLENGAVRDIVKDDYILTTCGYPYPERNELYISKVNTIINSLSDDPEQIKSITSLLSLPLWGSNTNEIFAELTGSGGNGKGLLDTGIDKVFGNYYCSIHSSQLTEYIKDKQRANSSLAKCRFARIVMASEPEDSFNGKTATLKVPILKSWTGQDKIEARFLMKDTFEFKPKFVLMLQCNDLVDLSNNDDAIKRRMKIFELPFKFVKNEGQILESDQRYRNENLKSLIATNEYRNALFYILLDTWLETKGVLFESNKVKNFTAEFFDTQNPVKIWFNTYYIVDNNITINSTEMYRKFKDENYESTMSQIVFGRLLTQICKKKRKTNGNAYYCREKTNEEKVKEKTNEENEENEEKVKHIRLLL